MISGKKIFIAALDWGMGHSTRTAALARDLEKDNSLVFGVTDVNRNFFDEQFPGAQKIELPSYNIRFSKKFPAWFPLLKQWSGIKKVITQENLLLRNIIIQQNIDLIISDSRYGLYSSDVRSVLISHQCNIFFPPFSFFANRVHKGLIQRFSELWIPDQENEEKKLAGTLSNHKDIPIKTKFIGPLSLWTEKTEQKNKTIDALVIISGVEPQKKILAEKIAEAFVDSDLKIVFAGALGSQKNTSHRFIEFANAKTLSELVAESRTVICRSGYSTLMDLDKVHFKGPLILVPTPGQTEQVYLAGYWRKKYNAIVLAQKKIDSTVLLNLVKTRSRPER